MIKIFSRKALSHLLAAQRFSFSGGHHPKPYDWRDDHQLNPYYELDPRFVGLKSSYEYDQPYQADLQPFISPFPAEYNPKDLTTNYIGTSPTRSIAQSNSIEPHSQNLWDDIAHEYEYKSQDLDFQPETFKSQHFRKKGMIHIWVLVALAPYILVITEVVYHQMVDGDGLKYQRPPPLNYPDDEDTPDFETYDNWKSPEFKYLHDAGLLKDPFFEIVDGKKIYNKWAGVNQPGVVIK